VQLALCKRRVIPASVFLEGVVIDPNRDPIGGGGFSDLFRGQYKGTPVALKKLRVFGEQQAKFKLVGFVSSLQ
jgi:hypothetical protein